MTQKQTDKFFSENNTVAQSLNYSVDDRNIKYIEVGDDQKPTVIFFHGAPGSWSSFKHFLVDSLLLNHVEMVAVDRPGYGHSDFGRSETSLQAQADLMKPLLTKYQNTPTILVGHSLGGPVVAKIAMEYPNLVTGLIMVAPSIDPDLEPDEDWFRVPMRSPFISWIIPTSFRVTNEEIYFLEDELRDMKPDWSRIKVPSTVIQGNKVKLVAPGNGPFAKKMLTNSAEVNVIMRDDMNHFVPWSHPELIKEVILEMIKKEKVATATPSSTQ